MSDGVGLGAGGFGLAAALSWGTSDFTGGVAARRIPVFAVMVGSYVIGLALLVALALAWGESAPAPADLAWAAAAGVVGGAGLTAHYRGLAVGRMGVVAPVAAVIGTAIPVLFGAVAEGLPSGAQMAGFVLALIGVWLVSRRADSGGGPSGLGLAVLAGLGFGSFFVLIDRVSQDAVFWPLVAARGASLIALLAVALANGRAWRPPRRTLGIVALAGILDVGGNTFFLLAAQAGRLDVASVLSSLYPAITVLLARGLLGEHIARWQGAGIVAAVIAVPLIAG
ncbi:MAG: EamA family transporter [Chloroflexota bacterium]|jgi:drug/metabolite transporter (DMT)-like permease